MSTTNNMVDAIRAAPGRALVVRETPITPRTLDEETRSVEAVLATENRVANLDMATWEIVDEILLMRGYQAAEKVILFDSHPEVYGDVRSEQIRGSVRDIRVQGTQLIGRIYFAEDQPSLDLWGKYRDGHADSVSPGFERLKTYRIEPGKKRSIGGREYEAGERPLHVTTKWRLPEMSTVPWGADVKAKVRQQPSTLEPEKTMNPRLRKYLESLGLRAEATDDQALQFLALLSGPSAQIANILESETTSDTARFAARAALRELGIDPDDPSKALVTRRAPATDPPADPPGDDVTPPVSRSDPVDLDAIRAEGARQEHDRVIAIRRLAGDSGDVPQQLVTQAIEEHWDEAHAAGKFLEAIRAGRSQSVGAAPAIHSRSREQDVTARSLAAGLLIGQGLDPTRHSMFSRGLPRPSERLSEQDADRGHELAGLSAADLFRECVRLDTGQWHMTLDRALEAVRDGALRSASTSGGTLSYVFGTNVYARLMAGWETIGDTTVGWCDEEDVANFLTQDDISLQANARLERLPRGDTAKHATMSDSREQYSIARYAKQFVVDEQDIIDDRLGAIMRMPEEMGEAARQLRPDMVYSIMLENPTMADTGAVFNSTAVTTTGGHANLGTAALSNDALKAAITAMVQQRINRTATDPGRQLNVRPRFLIVPADLEWTARQLTSAAALAKLFADSSDPWYAMLNLIAQEGIRTVPDDRIGAIGVMDPRTGTARTGSATNWFLAMGGNRGLRVAYRRGTGRRPQMRRFTLDRGQWGAGWDINLDIGVKFLEWRTWYMSSGDA